MKFLLDTNVISEQGKKRPASEVSNWLRTVPEADQYLSVMTIGELAKGVDPLRDVERAAALNAWITETIDSFGDRIVVIDRAVAERWGQLQSGRDPLPVVDSLLAATALVHGWTIATRNVRDFERCGVPLVNPFEWAP